jgi:hypothetical protein
MANILRRPDNRQGATVPGSHAEGIVVDYFETDKWDVLVDADAQPEPDVDLPPPAPRPSAD